MAEATAATRAQACRLQTGDTRRGKLRWDKETAGVPLVGPPPPPHRGPPNQFPDFISLAF